MDQRIYRRKVWKLRALIVIGAIVFSLSLLGVVFQAFIATPTQGGVVVLGFYAVLTFTGLILILFPHRNLESLHRTYREQIDRLIAG